MYASPQPSHDLFSHFMLDDLPHELLKKAAVFINLLSYDSSFISIIPLEWYKLVLECAESNFSHLADLDMLCPELVSMIDAFRSDYFVILLDFLKGLETRLCQIHDNDIEPQLANPSPNSYNPAKFGRAYYFTNTGEQQSVARPLSLENFAKIECKKYYPNTHSKGSSYLFLWFCTLHGHCYGFHMIDGGEGRKDPCYIVYIHIWKNLQKLYFMILHVVWMNTCVTGSLVSSKKKRCFHDIFHGYTHKCSQVFQAKRLNNINCFNTSICEQFNSFIQTIKYSKYNKGRLISHM